MSAMALLSSINSEATVECNVEFLIVRTTEVLAKMCSVGLVESNKAELRIFNFDVPLK